MKRVPVYSIVALFLISSLSITILLKSHGFAGNTPVQICEGTGTVYLSDVCWRAVKKWKQWCVATYDILNAMVDHGSILHVGTSVTPSYVRFTCVDEDDTCTEIITCTPLQEFYLYDADVWIPAYQLVAGVRLKSRDGYQIIIVLEHIAEDLEVYLIEVKDTHTFFVGRCGLLTHNTMLPWALSAGLSIPFGASAASGAAGAFFGPITLLAGAVIGTVAGIMFKIACDKHMPRYEVGVCDHDFMHPQECQTTTIISQDKQGIGCGDTTIKHPKPFITPIEPVEIEKQIGCPIIIIEEPKPLINVPVEQTWEDFFVTKDKQANNDTAKNKKERYDGPTFGRTEDWINSSPIGKEFERTDKGMQGKRAFRLKKKIPGLTGISQGEFVVIDALHKDHLEVYNKHGIWTHVANFDGSKNEEKTEQAKDGRPRGKLNDL